MQSLVLKGTEIVPASVLDAVHKKHLGKGCTDGAANSMQWRILSGKSRNPEHLPLLSRAAAIFRVCLTILLFVVSRLSNTTTLMPYGKRNLNITEKPNHKKNFTAKIGFK